MKWYIGQDVVCIKNHSQGIVKEGDVFTLQGIRKVCCQIELDVGLTSTYLLEQCRTCQKITKKDGACHWFADKIFAPLDSITDISEIEELLKEPIFQT